MAKIAPARITIAKTNTGQVLRLNFPKSIVDDPEFPLDLKKQIYARIVHNGILITHSHNGEDHPHESGEA